jgi:hypothetical protein
MKNRNFIVTNVSRGSTNCYMYTRYTHQIYRTRTTAVIDKVQNNYRNIVPVIAHLLSIIFPIAKLCTFENFALVSRTIVRTAVDIF